MDAVMGVAALVRNCVGDALPPTLSGLSLSQKERPLEIDVAEHFGPGQKSLAKKSAKIKTWLTPSESELARPKTCKSSPSLP